MNLKRLAIISIVVSHLLLNQSVASASELPVLIADEASLDQVITEKMTEAGIAGVGAAIIIDKKLVWMKGYGFADQTQKLAFTPDTTMNIGSISKTFTGVAMMQAVQQGKLALDEDINHYLPFKLINPYYPEEKITLRQLATHTSGITDRWAVYQHSYHYDGQTGDSLAQFMRSYFTPEGAWYSKDNFLKAKPGQQREYSNIAAGLAGYIVERAVGQPLNLYTKQHLFKPLGMSHSAWFLSELKAEQHSKLYVSQNGMTIPIPLYQITTYPDGGVRTSVSDLSRFFIALLNGGEYQGVRILDKKLAEEMTRLQFTATSKPENLELNELNSGLFWATKMDVSLVGHAGSDPGIRTEMLANLKGDTAVNYYDGNCAAILCSCKQIPRTRST